MFRPGKSGSVYSEGHDRIITLLSLLVQAGWEMILGKKKKKYLLFHICYSFSLLWNLLIQSIPENECY